MRRQIASVYLAGGADPEMMKRAYPHTNQIPARAFGLLKRVDKGPFADTTDLAPFVPKLGEVVATPSLKCTGSVDQIEADARNGLRLLGWIAWPNPDALASDANMAGREQPEMAVVTDESGRVVGWGASLGWAEPMLQSVVNGSRSRRFLAVGPLLGEVPKTFRVLGVSADQSRTCVLAEVGPPPPRFVADLPTAAEPLEGPGWHADQGELIRGPNGGVAIETPLIPKSKMIDLHVPNLAFQLR